MHRSSSKAGRAVWVCVCALSVSGVCATPRRAFADESPAELVSKGLELRRERRDAEALALFQSAYAAAESPMILAQIALAEQALARWLSAEQDLSAALATHDGWVESKRGVLEKALAVIQSHLSWLGVTSNVETAELWLDKRSLGPVRAAPFRVTEGPHDVSLRLRDGRSSARSLALVGGERAHLHIEFSAVAALSTEAPSHETATRAPERVQLVAPSSTPSAISTRQALAFASAAVSVVALAEAVTAQILRVDYVNQYNSEACAPNRSQQCAPYREVADSLGTWAVIGYAVAGTAALSSVALFTSPYWYPSAGPAGTQAGLSLSGRF